MICTGLGNGATICHEPMERIIDRPDGERWCFKCRKQREFRLTVDRPVEPSYYGSNPAIRCGTCQTADSDCFPGREREWDG